MWRWKPRSAPGEASVLSDAAALRPPPEPAAWDGVRIYMPCASPQAANARSRHWFCCWGSGRPRRAIPPAGSSRHLRSSTTTRLRRRPSTSLRRTRSVGRVPLRRVMRWRGGRGCDDPWGPSGVVEAGRPLESRSADQEAPAKPDLWEPRGLIGVDPPVGKIVGEGAGDARRRAASNSGGAGRTPVSIVLPWPTPAQQWA
jgi:hypothetical protein